MFYDFQKVLSYNSMLNFIIGERGVGKTYGATKFVINDFLKREHEFVYLRRYKTELRKSVPHFFDALKSNDEFKEHKLSVKNGNFFIDDKIAGYSMPLSTANILKSSSFPKVQTIIFDEFIIDKGTYHYLRNEVEQLLDIIETIARLRDIRVFFLGNAISITNPYFLYFKLDLPYHSDIRTYKDNLILVNYIKNEEYRKVKKQTKFGKLIEGTEYGKYAIDNEFLRDSSTFIARRPPDSKFYFILKIDSQCFGVWIDYNCNSLYVSNQYDNSTSLKLAVNSDSHDNSTYLIQYRKNTYFQALINFYRLSHLYFESQQIKNITMDFLKNYLTY